MDFVEPLVFAQGALGIHHAIRPGIRGVGGDGLEEVREFCQERLHNLAADRVRLGMVRIRAEISLRLEERPHPGTSAIHLQQAAQKTRAVRIGNRPVVRVRHDLEVRIFGKHAHEFDEVARRGTDAFEAACQARLMDALRGGHPRLPRVEEEIEIEPAHDVVAAAGEQQDIELVFVQVFQQVELLVTREHGLGFVAIVRTVEDEQVVAFVEPLDDVGIRAEQDVLAGIGEPRIALAIDTDFFGMILRKRGEGAGWLWRTFPTVELFRGDIHTKQIGLAGLMMD